MLSIEMIDRNDITSALIDLLPDQERITVQQATTTWYMNIRNSGGCRLTQQGYDTLQKLGLQQWRVDIDPKTIRKRTLLELDRKITFPYYLDLNHRCLVLFGNREAMMATLYGNINAWLQNVQCK